VNPQDHGSLEDITLHPQLSDLSQSTHVGGIDTGALGLLTPARRSFFTQFPNVPAPMPSSRATSTIGLPVSRTIVTAPSRNSA
jgi:hypothetical protein